MSLTVTPTDALTDGCPVLVKQRSVIAQKGTCPSLVWPLRDGLGNPVNLSEYLCTPAEESEESEQHAHFCGQVIFRFGDAIQPAIIQQVIGHVVNEAAGTVRCTLPTAVTDLAGIWRFEVAITNADGQIVAMDAGLLSVERNFFGDTTQVIGPPTLQELRMELRDSAIENSRIGDFEFSETELVYALAKPLQQWNERPPPLAPITAAQFPFRYNWTRAAVGELLSTAAHNYRRNKTQMSAGGITDQSLDRDNPYEAKAAELRQEWLNFVDHKKVEINASAAWNTLESGWY